MQLLVFPESTELDVVQLAAPAATTAAQEPKTPLGRRGFWLRGLVCSEVALSHVSLLLAPHGEL